MITRVDGLRWQAVEDDRVIGDGEASRRRDGRLFLSIDTWHGAVFDRLAAAMLADLPGPLYTMVDEADHDLTARWERAGLTVRRREQEYLFATDPLVTGPRHHAGAGGADPGPRCRARARAARGVRGGPRRGRRERGLGHDAGRDAAPAGRGAPGPGAYAVAGAADRYVGLVRVVSRRRHARIGLVAVREGRRRRGIARALLAEVLDALHRGGIATATAEVDERNSAATALFEGIGARRVGGTVEMVRGR